MTVKVAMCASKKDSGFETYSLGRSLDLVTICNSVFVRSLSRSTVRHVIRGRSVLLTISMVVTVRYWKRTIADMRACGLDCRHRPLERA
jgi:hypothetical protein